MAVSDLRQQLIEAWKAVSTDESLQRRRGMHVYMLTARKGSVSLFTAPTTTRELLFPGFPPKEVPGISFFFEDDSGATVRDFSDRNPDGTRVLALDDFFHRHRFDGTQWLPGQ